jgi:hypothetical protein
MPVLLLFGVLISSCLAQQVELLDNTGFSAPPGVVPGTLGTGMSYSGHCISTRKGYSFQTTQAFTLFRLDTSFTPQFGFGNAPATVEVLIEVWTNMATNTPNGTATYSARVVGLSTEDGGSGFTSLVLPSWMTLPASNSLFHAVTFSPQTSCSGTGLPWRSRRANPQANPTAGTGVSTVQGVQFSAGAWSTVNDFIPFRLIATPGTFTSLQTWTDSASGTPACAAGQIVNLGSNIAVFGLTTPNDIDDVDYNLSSVVFYMSTQATRGFVAAGTTYTLSLVSPVTVSGYVTPTGGTIVSTTGAVPTTIGVSPLCALRKVPMHALTFRTPSRWWFSSPHPTTPPPAAFSKRHPVADWSRSSSPAARTGRGRSPGPRRATSTSSRSSSVGRVQTTWRCARRARSLIWTLGASVASPRLVSGPRLVAFPSGAISSTLALPTGAFPVLGCVHLRGVWLRPAFATSGVRDSGMHATSGGV